MSLELDRGFFLGDYEVKPIEGQIRGPNGLVYVQPEVMEVLVCLAEHGREVVTRDQLVRRVWGDTAVADDVLTRCISKLRHALDDHREGSQYIQTIHRRGYRLLPSVRPVAAGESDSPTSAIAAPQPAAQPLQLSRLWAQVKRRRVVQVSISYAVAGWLIIQFASTVFPELRLPEWSVQLVILLIIAGFPIAVVVTWALQITPSGIVLDPSPSSPGRNAASDSTRPPTAAWSGVWLPRYRYRFLVALAISSFVGVGLTYYVVDSRIQFQAREWILLADFEDRTSDASLGQGLALAFRIGLEQSRYANVLPRSAARRALVRMQRDPEAVVDRTVGVEIALREHARALVLGSVVEVGGIYSLAAIIVDPQSDRTIAIETVNANSLQELLPATEQLTTRVRSALGESLAEIEDNSIALEKVTTSNLDALKVYSAGVQQAAKGRGEEAVALLQEAIEMDPEFAMAYASLGTVYRGLLENGDKASAQWEKALTYSGRLTQREQVYIEAAMTWHGKPQEMIRAWSKMSSLYPDAAAGHHNLGLIYWEFENDFEKAKQAFQYTVALPTASAPSYYYLGYCDLALGDDKQALDNFAKGWNLDKNPMEFGNVDVNVVLGRYGKANSFIEDNLARAPLAFQFEANLRRIGYFVDQGRLDEALATAKQTVDAARQHSNRRVVLNSQAAIVAVLERKGDSEAFERALEKQIAENVALLKVSARELDYSPLPQLALLGKIAARNGRYDLAQQALDAIGTDLQSSGVFVWESYGRILEAELEFARGSRTDAIATMEQLLATRDLFQAHESLARAYARTGKIRSAIEHYEWMTRHRGLAFAESLNRFYGKEFSIIDWAAAWFHLATLRSESGDYQGANAANGQFLEQWQKGDANLPMLRQARSSITLSSLMPRRLSSSVSVHTP